MIQKNTMTSKIFTIIRYLVGIGMLVFGANKLYSFMPQPEILPENMNLLMELLVNKSPFMLIIGVLEFFGGLALVLNKYVPLALIFLIAILFNAALFHLFFDETANAGGAIIFLALCGSLVFASKERFKEILSV